MQEIAMQFDRIDLGNGWCLFRPIGIVRGEYDAEVEEFVTEFGLVYSSIDSPIIGADGYYGHPTTIQELIESFNYDDDTFKNCTKEEMEESLITEYMDICRSNYYFGFYDIANDETYVIQKSFEDLEDDIAFSDFSRQVIGTSYDGYTEPRLSLNSSYLKKLLLENDIKEKIESFIRAIDHAKENLEKRVPMVMPSVSEVEKKYELKQAESKKLITISELRDSVKSIILHQDKAVDAVTRSFLINQTSENPNHKQHILIAGPSGTGKTKMIDIIAKEMNLPYFKADATTYSQVGYEGDNVYSMLSGLVNAADGDLEKAQNGILIIDEIDKKFKKDPYGISSTEVINSLLKIMDRDVVEVSLGSHGAQKVLFDTSKLTIVFMGAFEDLYKKRDEKNNKRSLGFGAEFKDEQVSSTKVTRQELIDYGVSAEWLGRVGLVTTTDRLDKEALKDILLSSKESPIKEVKEYFETRGRKITFSKGVIDELALRASKTNTGARNLRSELKEMLEYVYDDSLSGTDVKKYYITKKTIDDHKKYGRK